MFFVKMWLTLIALAMVVSGLVGWAALVRGGCHLYTRYNVESARHFCAEVFGLLVGSTVILMSMTEWPAFAKVVLQKNLNVASGCILITAVTVLELTLSYWLARFAFWAGKRWKFHVLQRQTLKQRVNAVQKALALACSLNLVNVPSASNGHSAQLMQMRFLQSLNRWLESFSA